MRVVPITLLETLFFGVLLLMWAVFLFGGLLIGKSDADSEHRMPRWTRMMASATLVTAAWFWFAISPGTQANLLALWIALGMSASLAGDLFMAKVFPVRQYIAGGMLAFAVAHIFYIAGLALPGHAVFAENASPQASVILFWLVAGLAGWMVVVWPASKRTYLHYGALPYSLLLAGTAGVAWSLALQDNAFVLTAIGATLFLLSDLVLGVQLFRRVTYRYTGDVVWLLYSPGQMLIVFGVLLHTIFVT